MNSFDPLDLRAQEKALANNSERNKLTLQTEQEDFKWLMGNKRGRRIVWRLLERTGVYRSSFTGNSETFFREGMRNVGLALLDQVHTITPDQFAVMLKEQRNSRMTDNALMMEATNTTDGSPATATAAPAEATQSANANAAPQQQSTQGSDSAPATNPAAAEQSKGAPEADSAKQTAPESYEFKAPDGVVFDDTTISSFSDVAKELNMPQADAQKILDKVGPVMAQRQALALENLNKSWVEGVQSDKEIGGEKLQENLSVARKAMDAFGTPQLRELLNESRLGNNPEMIRFMYRAGKAISLDKFVAGGPARPDGARDPAKFLYPNQTT